MFQQFVILVSMEGLENKYNLELSRGKCFDFLCVCVNFPFMLVAVLNIPFCVPADWKVLKNRKFLGSVSEQNIRTKSRPVIQELKPQYVPLTVSLSECTCELKT